MGSHAPGSSLIRGTGERQRRLNRKVRSGDGICRLSHLLPPLVINLELQSSLDSRCIPDTAQSCGRCQVESGAHPSAVLLRGSRPGLRGSFQEGPHVVA